ncbi:MAG: polyhydroxyalkanoic acid system family protein [Polyangiaceae bacterium]
MTTIDIRRRHSLSKDEAKKRAEAIATSLKEKLDLDWRWEHDRLSFVAPRGLAKGTKGAVSVSDTEVRVEIDLPFVLRVLKGKVESKVNEKLAQLG